jgi:hypothetical protein
MKRMNQPDGYGASNPEPSEFKDSAQEKDDALHASLEYINGPLADKDQPEGGMPCKNSLPT